MKLFLWLFIAAVSAIDLYLLVKYSSTLVEKNPMGCYLIALGGVPLFAGCKLFGTSIALGLLAYHHNHRFAFPVISGIAAFQGFLLCYLFS